MGSSRIAGRFGVVARFRVCGTYAQAAPQFTGKDDAACRLRLRTQYSEYANRFCVPAWRVGPNHHDAGMSRRQRRNLAHAVQHVGLNASAGLFSILQRNTAPGTAISAGCASFGYGLLEACLQLAEKPEQPVLFVYADEPAPAVYDVSEPAGKRAHALGLLLESSAETRIACSLAARSDARSNERQSQAFLRCLEQGEAQWSDAGLSWQWIREA